MFTLNHTLKQDTHFVARLALSQVLLMNNQDYPWIILVPEQEGVTEWIDLSPEQRYQLMDEITLLSTALKHLFKVDKLNIASLGNIVSQCHIHVIARRYDDAAWPSPVWGLPMSPYPDPQLIVAQLRAFLSQA